MENLSFQWSSIERLGILGGTFDPVHRGHILVARGVFDHFNLDRILFIPARIPPHKADRSISAPMHRYLMCILATVHRPHFSVSRLELQREGPSYTIDTLRQLQRLTGSDTELLTILGADMVLDIVNWHKPDAILDESTVIGVSRPGFDLQKMEQTLGAERSQKVEVYPADTPDISGTDIRRRVSDGKPIDDMVREAVCGYIRAAQLYR